MRPNFTAISFTAIKRACSFVGIDLDEIMANSHEYINSFLDKYLSDVQTNEDESKGVIITKDDKGYIVVKTLFHQDANDHMEIKGHMRLENLLKNIKDSMTNG